MPPPLTLLIVHHTASPAMHSLFESVVAGATTTGLDSVAVRRVPALAATASDVLDADGYLLGTPANIGYMSGALKHFFDQIYYPCLDATVGRPYGLWIHGNSDTEGARRAVEQIATGLGWQLAQRPVTVLNNPGAGDLEACSELGAALVAGLALAHGR